MYCNRSTHSVCSKLCVVQKYTFIIVYMSYKSARANIRCIHVYILLTNDMRWLYQNRYHYMGSLILRRGPQFSGDLGAGDPQISVVLGPGIPNSPEIWGRGSLILWVPNSIHMYVTPGGTFLVAIIVPPGATLIAKTVPGCETPLIFSFGVYRGLLCPHHLPENPTSAEAIHVGVDKCHGTCNGMQRQR